MAVGYSKKLVRPNNISIDLRLLLEICHLVQSTLQPACCVQLWPNSSVAVLNSEMFRRPSRSPNKNIGD